MLTPFQELADDTAWIIEQAKVHTLGWAGGNTGRIQSLCYSMIAEGAFIDIAAGMHDHSCIIGAGRNTGLTARAFARVDNRDIAVVPVMTGAGGAGIDAGRMRAVITAFRTVFATQVRVGAPGRLYDPVPIQSSRYVIFCLAGHHTVTAAYAGTGIDDHGIFEHLRRPRSGW